MVSDILPVGICAFTKFKSSMPKKGIISPIKIERPLALKVYSVLCSVFIISRFLQFVNIFSEFFNYLPGDRKKSYSRQKNNIPYIIS